MDIQKKNQNLVFYKKRIACEYEFFTIFNLSLIETNEEKHKNKFSLSIHDSKYAVIYQEIFNISDMENIDLEFNRLLANIDTNYISFSLLLKVIEHKFIPKRQHINNINEYIHKFYEKMKVEINFINDYSDIKITIFREEKEINTYIIGTSNYSKRRISLDVHDIVLYMHYHRDPYR